MANSDDAKPAWRRLIDDREFLSDKAALAEAADKLLSLEDHPGYRVLLALLEREATITTETFLDIDLSTPAGIDEMKILQNRVARPYVIREAIEDVYSQVTQEEDLEAFEED